MVTAGSLEVNDAIMYRKLKKQQATAGYRYQLDRSETLIKEELRLCHDLKTSVHSGVTKTSAELSKNHY